MTIFILLELVKLDSGIWTFKNENSFKTGGLPKSRYICRRCNVLTNVAPLFCFKNIKTVLKTPNSFKKHEYSCTSRRHFFGT
ncbi:MAG: hypothetical protein V4642_10810 [Bacteroidota bacterium]